MAAVIEDTDLRVQAPASFVVPIEKIDLGVNHRPIDPEHVEKLAASIALRGLIVPLQVQQVGDRFLLIAGYHRYPACFKVGLTEVPVSFRDLEGVSGDAAAENILRKPLTPVGEAKAIAHMLDEGYTLDGAAEVLGFSRQLVVARAQDPRAARARAGDARRRTPARRRRRRAAGHPAGQRRPVPGGDRRRRRGHDRRGAARQRTGMVDRPRRPPRRQGVRRIPHPAAPLGGRRAASRQEGRGRVRRGRGAAPPARPPRLRPAADPVRRRARRPGPRRGRAARARRPVADHRRQAALPRAGQAGDHRHRRRPAGPPRRAQGREDDHTVGRRHRPRAHPARAARRRASRAGPASTPARPTPSTSTSAPRC